ncbi:DUF2827 domain-containing protein [Trinickia acidisoli]|uniref:DUF2827 domain-containing protein n=1 Tax=Trinickia acidisoli TaxID=2767482 RepID=UPI001A8D9169|nr:DUF2827 domain-containing protein [Trinickia acidisoli]
MTSHAVIDERGPLRIGITIGLSDAAESLWINGIKQNALYLARLFQHSPYGHQVTLVNTTSVAITDRLPWDTRRFPVATFEDAKDRLDVLIELGGQVGLEATRYLKSRGTKLVSYCCGPEYVQNIEAMIFGRSQHRGIFINQEYDEIWVVPQVMETSAHFFKVLRRQSVREVPFVWDPMCLEQRCAALPHQGEYRPRGGARRIAIMEPNVDVLKFCLYPMLIVEQTYREAAGRIAQVYVTNAMHLAQHSTDFIGIAQYLDLVCDGKVVFLGTFDTPTFLCENADIVVSHQWALPLNYFYFDVCWKGYALIHNASLCKELGYFYQGNDVDQGASRLLSAVHTHDEHWEGYRARQRDIIAPFLATHPPLVQRYDNLLYNLLAGITT